MRGEEPRSPWQQHTCTVNRKRGMEGGRVEKNVIVVHSIFLHVCACIDILTAIQQVCACVCVCVCV